MEKHTGLRIDLNTNDRNPVQQMSNDEPEIRDLGFQALEHRYMPLVVIAIIAVLIGLLLPA